MVCEDPLSLLRSYILWSAALVVYRNLKIVKYHFTQNQGAAYKQGFAILKRVKKLTPKVWMLLIIRCGLYTGFYGIYDNVCKVRSNMEKVGKDCTL